MKNILLNAERKIRSIWWVPIFFCLLAILLLPTIIVAQNHSADVPIYVQAILIIVVTIICQLIRRESISIITGNFNLNWFKQFLNGLLIGAALMILPAITLTLLGLAEWRLNDFSFSIIISGFTVFISVAVAEEFLFRGFLFQRLNDSFGEWPAQLLLAGLFLLTHINNPGMVGITKVLASLNIFIASIMFGLAFLKTRSLAMPIGLHFMANFMQGTILGFGVSGDSTQSVFKVITSNGPSWLTGGEFGLEASALGLIAVIIIAILLYRRNTT